MDKIDKEFDMKFHDSGSGLIGCVKHGYKTICVSKCIKTFIHEKIKETREELIKEIEKKEIAIQGILAPYFVVLDGRDNTSAEETIIEISQEIINLLKNK